MVRNVRLKRIVYALALYSASAVVSTFFVWQAGIGDRGLKAKAAYQQQILDLRNELAGLRRQSEDLTRQVAQFQATSVDRDLLDEEARLVLGRRNGTKSLSCSRLRRGWKVIQIPVKN